MHRIKNRLWGPSEQIKQKLCKNSRLSDKKKLLNASIVCKLSRHYLGCVSNATTVISTYHELSGFNISNILIYYFLKQIKPQTNIMLVAATNNQ